MSFRGVVGGFLGAMFVVSSSCNACRETINHRHPDQTVTDQFIHNIPKGMGQTVEAFFTGVGEVLDEKTQPKAQP